jgi:transposase
MERWTGSFARAHTLSICVRLADSGSLQEGVDAPGIRRLLIVGAMSVIRWASRRGAPEGSWLSRMLARKPLMLVATALANKMARTAWAMLVKQENYRVPVMMAA